MGKRPDASHCGQTQSCRSEVRGCCASPLGTGGPVRAGNPCRRQRARGEEARGQRPSPCRPLPVTGGAARQQPAARPPATRDTPRGLRSHPQDPRPNKTPWRARECTVPKWLVPENCPGPNSAYRNASFRSSSRSYEGKKEIMKVLMLRSGGTSQLRCFAQGRSACTLCNISLNCSTDGYKINRSPFLYTSPVLDAPLTVGHVSQA